MCGRHSFKERRIVGTQRFNAEAPIAQLVSAEAIEFITGTVFFAFHLLLHTSPTHPHYIPLISVGSTTIHPHSFLTATIKLPHIDN
jgi:hypothetical protein